VSYYVPVSFAPGRYGYSRMREPHCRFCGQRSFVHEDTGRCYTPLELEAALRFMQRQGRWPDGMLAPAPEETL
jgi:hypothetical protein